MSQRTPQPELAALYQIALELGTVARAGDVLQLIVQRARSLLNADASYTVLYNEREEVMTIGPEVGLKSDAFKKVRVKPGDAASGWIFKSRTAAVTLDYYQDTRFPHTIDAEVAEEGIRSGVGVPLLFRDEVLGVLFVISRSGTSFTPEQMDLLNVFATQASIALGMAKINERLEQQNQKLTALNELGSYVLEDLDFESTLRSIVFWSARLFNGFTSAVWLSEEDAFVLHTHTGGGVVSPVIHTAEVEPFFSGEPVTVRELAGPSRAMFFGGSVDSALITCLDFTYEGLKAVIGIGYTDTPATKGEDLPFVQAFGKYALMAVRNAAHYTRADQKLAERAKELAVLHDLGRALFTVNDHLADLFRLVSSKVMDVFDVGQTALIIPQEGNHPLAWTATLRAPGWFEEVPDLPLVLPPEWRERDAAFEVGAADAGPAGSQLGRLLATWEMAGSVAVPLKIGHEFLGIFLANPGGSPLDQRRRVFLAQAVNLMTLALKNRQLKIRARELAIVAERNRIASDLHDTVIQILFSAGLSMDRLLIDLKHQRPPTEESIRHLQTLVQRAVGEVRNVVYELSNTDANRSLVESLQELLGTAAREAHLKTHMEVDGLVPHLPVSLTSFLVRSAKELVTNGWRHALAQNLTLRLHFTPQEIRLAVVDDGTGRAQDIEAIIENDQFHFGLMLLRERLKKVGGRLEITDHEPRGITATVYLNPARFN